MEKVGKCALCGREGPLSYEHIPPREAFNDKRVRTITGDDYFAVTEWIPTKKEVINNMRKNKKK